MADFLEKAITLGLGVEKKLKDILTELESAGEEKKGEKEAQKDTKAEEGETIGTGKRIENKVVEEGVKAVREFIELLKDSKSKIEDEVCSKASNMTDRLNLATKEDVTIAKEMARVAREKVDSLEKKVEELIKDKE
ncbi:MAG: hypothetical protein KAR06_11480 [Deltaproteobacteria bacterium]|nr:hypothetical protein [Deltaproteobacteria bacterium]